LQFGIFPLGFLDVSPASFTSASVRAPSSNFGFSCKTWCASFAAVSKSPAYKAYIDNCHVAAHCEDDRDGVTLFLESFVHVALKKLARASWRAPLCRRILFYERGEFVDGLRLISH